VFSCVADAVIVIGEYAGDLNLLAREFVDFTRAPVTAFFGQAAGSKKGFTQHKSFNTSEAEACVAYLKRELKAVKSEIARSFELYDINSDGRIDLGEMRTVS